MLFASFSVHAAEGMHNIASEFSVTETANRFEQILNEKGVTVFNRILHSEAADKVGIQLRETQLIIFGNPKVGSPLMKCQQSMAIDLPQKALIWKDKNNDVWISYNDMMYLKNRHVMSGCEEEISKVSRILDKLITSAASR